MNFDEAFLRLNGREPTGEEKRDALMIQDVVRGADLDPVLLVFLALGKYETLYRQGAQRIATAVDEAALQAAFIGERVGRKRAEQTAIEGTMRKLASAIEHRATPTAERTKQLALSTLTAIVVTSAMLLALAFGRIDGFTAAHSNLEAATWLPPWGWMTAGVMVSESIRLVTRPLKTRKW